MTDRRTPEWKPVDPSGYPFPVIDPERDAAMRTSLGIETPEEVRGRLLAEIDRLRREKLAWKREALRLGSDGLGGGERDG